MLAGEQIGPFAVEKEIGSGAMGAVYRARYTKTGLTVAIKIVATGLDASSTILARFEREMAILKKLNHPNIVRLYATGRFRGKPFYAMEYVEGESLEQSLQRRTRFPWEEVAQLGQQICAGLQHAHEQGIVHRDLKPANIMVAVDGTPKLTDFGIAKALEVEQLTATNTAIGTAAYMSPEQCRGERNLTSKSDLYSLGVMFYQLLTGRTPFVAESILDMFQAHVEGTFERPSRLVLDIPIWLDTLVCQMLEKQPDKRPMNADVIAQSLGRIVDKVAAQRSAGLDMVSTKIVDRPRTDLKADDSDRAAARELKAGGKKKRRKAMVIPWHQRVWLNAALLAGALLAVGALIWWAMRPPSPEVLFRRAAKLMASRELDDWEKARSGPIALYLERYPDLGGSQAGQMHTWADEVDGLVRERQMYNRLKRNLAPDGPEETKARAAVHDEDAGDFAAAREGWKALEKERNAADPDQRAWGQLALLRLRKLDEVDAREKQLRDQVQQSRLGGQELKSDSDAERQAALAIHFEVFGDLGSAVTQWRDLQEKLKGDQEQRPWFLLAARKVRDLTPRVTRTRQEVIQEQLQQALKWAANEPINAQILCHDIISLYGADRQLLEQVEQARKLLRQLVPPAPGGSEAAESRNGP